jgi:hypothetical protein
MLRSLKDLEQYSIAATDGQIGHVKDFYFDDDAWVIRYLIVATGASFKNRNVLISPISVHQPDWAAKSFPVALTQAQVANSPDIDTKKPVSRQHEMGYLGYYGYPNYWGGGGLWGAGIYPDILLAGRGETGAAGPTGAHSTRSGSADDLHLRSGNEVMRYYVHAKDGDIGHVQGILVDENTWAIRYMIVDTSNWWLGHEVLIAPQWVEDFYWEESKLNVAMTRQQVKDAPLYDSTAVLDRDHEAGIHEHYGRDAYWPREAKFSSSEPRR